MIFLAQNKIFKSLFWIPAFAGMTNPKNRTGSPSKTGFVRGIVFVISAGFMRGIGFVRGIVFVISAGFMRGIGFVRGIKAFLKPCRALTVLMPLIMYFPAYSEKASPVANPNAFEKFFPFILLILVFYFLLIRPAQKKQQAQNQFINSIKVGDEVLTNGGIYGRVQAITEEFIKLEVAEKVYLRVVKSQITRWQARNTEKTSERSNKALKASKIKT